jgi:hypothetical protein
MLKLMAVVRTLFLVFIVAFTVRSMPWAIEVPKTHDEQYARVAASASALSRAAWYAVGWIGFETIVGWWLATRRARPAQPAAGARDAAAPKP